MVAPTFLELHGLNNKEADFGRENDLKVRSIKIKRSFLTIYVLNGLRSCKDNNVMLFILRQIYKIFIYVKCQTKRENGSSLNL